MAAFASKCFVVAATSLIASCARQRPADVAPSSVVTSARVTTADSRSAGELEVAGWRYLSRGITRAVATDDQQVYFGDELTRALFRVPKVGGPPIAIGVPAPRDIAFGAGSVVWIGAPGNVVVRAARTGGPGVIIRDRGAFSAVAARGADVYVAEITGKTGALTRITGPTATRVAVFDAPVRALAMDDSDVFVQTSRTVARVSRATGRVAVILAGAALSRLAIDATSVYTTVVEGPSRAVVRVPKSGGYGNVLERGVRDAPIAAWQGDVYYLDEDQPTLRRVASAGGASAIVARAPELEQVTAIAVDPSGIFVGTESVAEPDRGDGAGGAVIAMPLIAIPRAPR